MYSHQDLVYAPSRPALQIAVVYVIGRILEIQATLFVGHL